MLEALPFVQATDTLARRNVHEDHPHIKQIRLLGLLLRLVRAGECRFGHDPTAYGCLAAHRALESRERLTSEKGALLTTHYLEP
jgi:hypothetical protein